MRTHIESSVRFRRHGDDAPTIDAHRGSLGGSLGGFLGGVRHFPMLEPEEEHALAKSWRERRERHAAHRLVTSHLRLVVKAAFQYRGYGLPVAELISEGTVGLMHAANRFKPEKDCRSSTYAMWWIRVALQDYVLRSWSLVKIGTTANQKKLFFGLRRARSRIAALEGDDLRPDQVEAIAGRLGVSRQDVIHMNHRLGGDVSLNAPIRHDSDAGEWQDRLVEGRAGPDIALAETEEGDNRRRALAEALTVLSPRERRIFAARQLLDGPLTLEDLAGEFGVSRERVRQIEARAFEKVRTAVKARIRAIEGV